MTSFTSLSPTIQDLFMVNFEFFGKLFILGIALVSSLLYLFYFKPKFKPSPFLLVGNVRGLLSLFSVITLTMLPFTIFYLFPYVSIEILLQFMIWFYIVGLAVGFIVLITNTLIFGATFPALLLGDGDSDRHRAIYKKIKEESVGKKWGGR